MEFPDDALAPPPRPDNAAEAIRNLLTNSTVEALMPQSTRKPIVLKSSATVGQALQLLAGARILSAPVVVAAENGAANDQPVGEAQADASPRQPCTSMRTHHAGRQACTLCR
jgi:hypothetical protein